jgi:uncharacterized membrane protein
MITTDQGADQPGREAQPPTQTPTADRPALPATATSNQRHTTPAGPTRHHPALLAEQARRADDLQLRIADKITAFAGSMNFVYLHIAIFAIWMLFIESSPWPTLTLIVSLEAIFLSTFVMIGQNRQAAFQQVKADHDFTEQELELKTNTQLTREIHTLTTELHNRLLDPPTHPPAILTARRMGLGPVQVHTPPSGGHSRRPRRFPRPRALTDRRGKVLDPRQPRLLAYPEGFRAVKRSRQARSQRRHASAQTRQCA